MPRGRPKKEIEPIPYVDGLAEGYKIQNIALSRLEFDDTELEFRVDHKIKDLVDDIQKNGQQFPVILRPYEGSRKLQIVSGFRRSRAIKALGWDTVKGIIRADLDDDMAFKLSYLENEKRKSLTGIDKANAIVKLRLKGKDDAEIGEIYGIGQRQIERYQKVSTFPDTLKTAIGEDQIQTTHGLALMKVHEAHGSKVNLTNWVEQIIEEDLSVRQLTRALNAKFGKVKAQGRYMEKTKSGGFRLYPMRYDPKTTDDQTKEKMLEKLKMAVALLERS